MKSVQLKIKIDFSSEKQTLTTSQVAPFDPVKIRNFGLFLILMSSLVCSMAYSMLSTEQAHAYTTIEDDSYIGILPIIVEDDQPPKQPDIVFPEPKAENIVLAQESQLLVSPASTAANDVALEAVENKSVATTEPTLTINTHDVVIRAQLTSAVTQREPVDNLNTLSLKQQRQFYFFTQITQHKDKEVYHRWLFNDKVMARVTLAVGSNKWRTYSSKTFNESMLGRWKVEVLNGQEKVLKRIEFDVTQ